MLPFLKPKAVGLAVDIKKAGPTLDEKEETDIDPGLMAAADALIDAIQSDDSKAVALALKDAFVICDSMPEEEPDGDGAA